MTARRLLLAGLLAAFAAIPFLGGTTETSWVPRLETLRLPAIIPIILGGLAGGLLTLAARRFLDAPASAKDVEGAILIVLIATLACLSMVAAVSTAIAPLRAALVFSLLVLASFAAARCIARLAEGAEIGFESHWGGLGGGGGGWRMLPATGLGLLALIFTGVAIAAVFVESDGAKGEASNKVAANTVQANDSVSNGVDNGQAAGGAARTGAASTNGATSNAVGNDSNVQAGAGGTGNNSQ
ncbi:MAG TPA: hypothetical protein VF605_00530 [Allosphingosinicella sp.]|jgi:hypothetical protein